SPAEFMEQTKKMAAKVVEDAVKMSADWSFTGLDTASIQRSSYKKSSRTPLGSCVKCEGKMVDKGTFYGCSNYSKTKCDFTLSKKILGKTITQAQIKKLLS